MYCFLYTAQVWHILYNAGTQSSQVLMRHPIESYHVTLVLQVSVYLQVPFGGSTMIPFLADSYQALGFHPWKHCGEESP